MSDYRYVSLTLQVDERGKCLKWTRVLDVKEQNQLKAQAEEPVAAVDPEEAYAELSIGDLKYRDHLIEDSFECFRKLSPDAMHRIFRFSFVGEPAQDAGGVAREWFHELTRGLYNVELGLFEYSAVDNLCYQVIKWFWEVMELEYGHEQRARLLQFSTGTSRVPVQGFKALQGADGNIKLFTIQSLNLDQSKFPKAHMTVPLYKHMLGWPIMVSDLEYVDPQYAKSLTQVLDSDAEMLEALCLDFTVTICEFGEHKEVLLCANGSEQTVDQENRGRYVEKILKYHMFDRMDPVDVPTSLLPLGLACHHSLELEVVPPGLLSVFDYGQLELLLCGLPDIDLQDWKLHTKYAGAYEAKGLEDQAHTCFNRIELPMYTSKEQLRKFVTMAIMMENTGFGIE
eukprot:gene2831-3629_t